MTSNFNNQNASKIYAAGADDFIYEDTRDNINYELNKTDWLYFADDGINIESNRSYPATSIGALTKEILYYGVELGVEIIPKTVSGYYEGFNLDYDLKYTIDGEEYSNDLDYLGDDLQEFSRFVGYNQGLIKANLVHIKDKFISLIEEGTKITEHAFSLYTCAYDEVARFSNGECIYEKSA